MITARINISQKNIDSLVSQLWAHGFTPISRRYGTYLPEPPRIGAYDVDVVAKSSRDHAIAIYVPDSEIRDKNILHKISFLAGRKLKYANKKVLLFVGVSPSGYPLMKELIASIDADLRKQIRLVVLADAITGDLFASEGRNRFNIV